VTWTVTGKNGDTVTCTTSNDTVNKKTGKVTCRVAAHTLMAADSPYTVAVAYSGDANFAASNGTFSQTMVPVNSKVRVTGSSTTAAATSVTYTALVTAMPAAADIPTGTVTFVISSSAATQPTCNGGDTVMLSSSTSPATATCTISGGLASANSPYMVSATYSGDGNDNPSTATMPKTTTVKVTR